MYLLSSVTHGLVELQFARGFAGQGGFADHPGGPPTGLLRKSLRHRLMFDGNRLDGVIVAWLKFIL